MPTRRLAVLAVAAFLSLSAITIAQEYKFQYAKYKEVPGIQKDEAGQRYILVGEDAPKKYYVFKHEENKLIYFVDIESNEAQWHDPRGPEPSLSTEQLEQVEDVILPVEPPKPKTSGLTVAIVAMLPILLLAGGTAARVAYLQMYYPELLWPTKERRDRRKASSGKVKPQKQRGKMNQDGKGGRSANS